VDKSKLVGRKFGKLTVIAYDETKSTSRRKYWLCDCECGGKTSVRDDILKNGKTVSCNCARKKRINKAVRVGESEVGNKYGRLTILSILPYENAERTECLCRCDCGNIKPIDRYRLVNGYVKSCGCLSRENSERLGISNRIDEGEANFNFLYNTYKTSAKHRELEFSLTKEEFKILTKGDCYYCGGHPDGIRKRKDSNGGYIYNGIDRVNNNLGYVSGNVVSCCKWCNIAKSTRGSDDFLEWAINLYRNIVGKNLLIEKSSASL
jgi:hypothetical protein